jgi:hypothetical protein
MKVLMLISVVLTFYACNEKPRIALSNTLEISLRDKYPSYVNLLNKSLDSDTAALLDFFKINQIYDAAGYDHGYILIQLMKKVGDKEYASILQKLDKNELSSVLQYFEVGIDGNERVEVEIENFFPITSKIILHTDH